MIVVVYTHSRKRALTVATSSAPLVDYRYFACLLVDRYYVVHGLLYLIHDMLQWGNVLRDGVLSP